MSEATGVVVTEQNRILVVTINRPHARNAIDAAVSRALADAMDRLDAEPDLSVGVLTGAGGNFCAGMDLKAFARGETASIRAGDSGSPNVRPSSR